MKQFVINGILSYLRCWARIALKRHTPYIIGITGTVGKSSTCDAMLAVLKDHFPTKLIGNSETGIPLGILGMKPKDYSPLDWLRMLIRAPFGLNYLKGTTYVVVEMGIDEPYPPKNMSYLLTIVKPDTAIFLNAAAMHIMQFEKLLSEEHKTMSEHEQKEYLIHKIAEEKGRIITDSGCKIGLINNDNNYVAKVFENWQSQNTKLISYGTKSDQIVYENYKVTLDGTTFVFSLQKEKITLSFSTYILPKEYQEVFAPVILTAQQLGLSLEQIKKSLEKNFHLPYGRASIFKGTNGSTIIDSSYNASKPAVLAFLGVVKELKQQTKRPVVFIFGDMRELGNESASEHAEVAQAMVGIVDYLYLVGQQTREYVFPIIQQYEKHFKEINWYNTSKRAGEYVAEHMAKDALVLVKGSQNTIFLEEAVKQLLKDKKDSKKLCRQEDFWMKKKAFMYSSD